MSKLRIDIDGEELKFFWIGKNPKTKTAVLEYWNAEQEGITQILVAEKHGITAETVGVNIRKLKKMGYTPKNKREHKKYPCILCKKDLAKVYPKYLITRLEKGLYHLSSTREHLCVDCYARIEKSLGGENVSS